MNNRVLLAFTLLMRVVQAGAVAPDVMMLGTHVHNPMDIPSAASAGYKTIGLWDSGTDWASLEPKPGVWQFNRIDTYLTQSEKAKLKVIWTLGLTPRWASARPDENCPYGFGCAAEPYDINDWRNYVHTIATKYKGRIEAYEPWNEVSYPNDSQFSKGTGGDPHGFFTGNVGNMVTLTQVAYEEVKKADPNALVLSPSIHYTG
jgi:GH35 family endo-1,4-beta-xylanase